MLFLDRQSLKALFQKIDALLNEETGIVVSAEVRC